MATNVPVGPETLITVKISIQGCNRKFKIPLKDLGANVLPDKLRHLLSIPANQYVVFERFSDSAGAYIVLDPENPQVFKTLFRAAKAKLKLRLRATLPSSDSSPASIPSPTPQPTEKLAENATPPPIVSSTPRTSTGPAQTTVKTREPPTAEPKFGSGDEAPTPRPFTARDNFFTELANLSKERELAIRMKGAPHPAPQMSSWSVYCNSCDRPMMNEHYHCSICDDGDYDLCRACVEAGTHCPGEGHWLIKRFVKNGNVINSTTERIAPKPKQHEVTEKEMPGAFTSEEKKAEAVPTRTCNSCVKVLPENQFVTCIACEDYDLCVPCHIERKHGHHPGHGFKPATADTVVSSVAEALCAPGRNVKHAALCDGCDKYIYGVRHKCLNCPDWDYCCACIKNAKYIHPHHRFVPVYEPLPDHRRGSMPTHRGIFCDGPLCKNRPNQYIEGTRYKCAVCHDTDFCANCEASPQNKHNRTHPLIKFKTPVRNVSVTTLGEAQNGSPMATMGDQPQRRSMSTETAPTQSANAATQVQTIVDLKPTEESPVKPNKEKIQIKDLLAEPIQEKIKVQDLLNAPIPESVQIPLQVKAEHSPPKSVSTKSSKPHFSELNAHYIRDTVADGTKMRSDEVFTQVWTLRNPGPHTWPAGCSVRYVGGDNMLNLDPLHPSSATDIAEATESNVIGREVKAGEECDFGVRMKSPMRPGTSISYWRLKASDGTPFGHRLWCHIDVSPRSNPVVDPVETTKVALEDHKPVQSLLEKPTESTLAGLRARLELLSQQNVEATKQAIDTNAVLDTVLENLDRTEKKIEALEAKKAPEEPTHKVEQVSAEKQPRVEDADEEKEVVSEGSTMIFPQLEKESPVASIHEPVASSATSDVDLFEDAESIEITEADSSDDEGFATDEEYDVLGASDEEFI
ncbi:hypothetical protein M501DRAFT_931424 [Patellaria atrata CBS 101060]|uniref:ZZ-type domain-containing protein n=1 Tax=Patellaria atrata CBS 101060 TaxID=1346257 RepID=A0A9P4SCM0_9PEZI|nr:hypothetical protein M501DRAFT_931424 [Patellaria atrata CBS 101060]